MDTDGREAEPVLGGAKTPGGSTYRRATESRIHLHSSLVSPTLVAVQVSEGKE